MDRDQFEALSIFAMNTAASPHFHSEFPSVEIFVQRAPVVDAESVKEAIDSLTKTMTKALAEMTSGCIMQMNGGMRCETACEGTDQRQIEYCANFCRIEGSGDHGNAPSLSTT